MLNSCNRNLRSVSFEAMHARTHTAKTAAASLKEARRAAFVRTVSLQIAGLISLLILLRLSA
ncbi:MAG TPA: hypothetical protein VFK82_08665 [Burkholderiaceae bacterium]|nr:hypothetical protein [Burkholderiaceae bacterium]